MEPDRSSYQPPPKKPRRWVHFVGYPATLLVGAAIGTSGDTADPVEPEVVVETETVTETVEVLTVPESCAIALSEADRGFSNIMEFLDVVQEYPLMVFEAAEYGIDGDIDGLDSIADRLTEKTDQINKLADKLGSGANYRENADLCLAEQSAGD